MSSDPVAIGSEIEVEFVVRNEGSSTIDACFGLGFQAEFLSGDQARGSIDLVDHPACVQRFELSPGGTVSRRYKVRVPALAAGPAKVGGGVQVVDPAHCDHYGCDRAWLKAAYDAVLEIAE